MRFDVDPTAPVPPSEQIADPVRFAVSSGRVARLVAGLLAGEPREVA